ncbi:MAG: twin-arginine translocase TatA/TatE family subunit [Chitinophagaceae bacterium]|jgi:sec-independent protein translocase protein TatA|nr:MAG: twin-arginine translocase TatA/TatE family subunit [Chitinophagaceae bacterium]
MAPALLKSVFLFDLPNGFEWIIIIAVFLLLFGGKKIPELMRGLGRGIREFNDAKDNVKKEIEDGMKEERKPSSNSTAATASQEQAHS